MEKGTMDKTDSPERGVKISTFKIGGTIRKGRRVEVIVDCEHGLVTSAERSQDDIIERAYLVTTGEGSDKGKYLGEFGSQRLSQGSPEYDKLNDLLRSAGL